MQKQSVIRSRGFVADSVFVEEQIQALKTE
jgi:hypothetical protein